MAGLLFPRGAVSGFRSGVLSGVEGESKTIVLGSGLLFVYTSGAALCYIYTVDYWTEQITTIFSPEGIFGLSLSKTSSSPKVNFSFSRNRMFSYIFIGEGF